MRRHCVSLVLTAYLAGCVTGAPKYTTAAPDFQQGLAAIDRNDFPLAAFHFSELAKTGDPAAMNNLGVSLLVVDRRAEAVFWFNKAARYGEENARATLQKMGESVPAPDLVGRHPAQLQREERDRVVSAVALGLLLGVSGYYAAKAGGGSVSSAGELPPLIGHRPLSDRKGSGVPVSPATPLIEKEIEATDTYTRERYGGTRDAFGNAQLRKKLEPQSPAYKGTLDSDGSGTLRDDKGNTLKVR